MGEFFKFSKIAATGIRVPRNTHAPLTLPGMLSTAGHCDQSRVAMLLPTSIVAFTPFYHRTSVRWRLESRSRSRVPGSCRRTEEWDVRDSRCRCDYHRTHDFRCIRG